MRLLRSSPVSRFVTKRPRPLPLEGFCTMDGHMIVLKASMARETPEVEIQEGFLRVSKLHMLTAMVMMD
jgi:hypothetical protein